jgi:hypothetical protein
MYGNGEPDDLARFAKNVVAAPHTQQASSVAFKNLCQVFAGDLPHTAISSTRCFPSVSGALTFTDRQASTAS